VGRPGTDLAEIAPDGSDPRGGGDVARAMHKGAIMLPLGPEHVLALVAVAFLLTLTYLVV